MKPERLLPFVVLLLLVGCSTPRVNPERPSPTATPVPASILTPDTNEPRSRPEPILGQLVLATQLDRDDAPRDDRTTIPPDARQLYLVVRASDVPAGSRLVAVWLRGSSEVGRTELPIEAPTPGPRWFALAFPADAKLTAGDYVVRLYLDDRFVDSIVFSVGGSRGATSLTETLVFTDSPPSGSGALQAFDTFPYGTVRVVAVLTDISTDTSENLWSRWSVDGQVLTERGGDEITSPFFRTFTLQRDEPLPAGTYTVEIFADQQMVAQGSFRIVAPSPTPTPGETVASVEDVRVVRAVEPGSGAPVGAAVRSIQAPARVYVTVLVRGLQPTDTLEVLWERAGTEVLRQPLSGLTLSSHWIAFPLDLPEETGTEPVPYRVRVFLNGTEVAQRTFLVMP
ncbi:MAG: hypothetical protein N2Z82_05715 [Thermomicrobium sp.]|nr:hypothetical protein [Thermomicrobium sp.]